MKRLAAALLLLALTACGAQDDPVRRQVLKHEELIADCMHRNGFEYIAAVPVDLAVQEARRSGKDLDTAIAERPEDPNDAVLANLSEERQNAWGDALYGTETTPGCYNETYKSAWGRDMRELSDKGDQIVAKVQADPNVQKALKTYVDCMRGNGFRVSSPDSIYELGEKAQKSHDECVKPYDTAYDKAYLKYGR
ncbi:hypothetical protein [Lentzea sp. NPDC051838]|uniref:hypothetical protein n=1 Tax=Lentzea sp. NPDC051838 TaxID=3154849 RepID=UPI00341D406C